MPIVAYQPNKSGELFEPSVLSTIQFSSWSRNWITGQIKSDTWTPNDIVAKWIIRPKVKPHEDHFIEKHMANIKQLTGLYKNMAAQDNINPIFDHKDGDYFKKFALFMPEGAYKPPNNTIKFKSNKTYHAYHVPSGESWVILGVSPKNNRVCAAGWPPTMAKLSDCKDFEEQGDLTLEERIYREDKFGSDWL